MAHRILVIDWQPPGSRHGGADTFLGDLLPGLAEHGSVTLLGCGPLLAHPARGITVREWAYPYRDVPFGGIVRQYLRRGDILAALTPVLADLAPTVVVLSRYMEQLVLTRHLVRRGISVVWVQHIMPDLDAAGGRGRGKILKYRLLALACASGPTAIACDSQAIADGMKHCVPAWRQRLHVIRLGISEVDTASVDRGSGDRLRIGYVANFSAAKGQQEAPNVLAALHDRGITAVQLCLAGHGCDDGLAARLRACGDSVERRELDPSEVPQFLRSLDLYVSLSRSEGFPYHVLEAMRAGLPVVAYGVGGIPEQISNGRHGYVVPAGETGMLAQRLAELCRDGNLRSELGRAGQARVAEEFTLDRMREAYRHLLEQLCG